MRYILYGASKYMQERVDENRIQYVDYIVDKSEELVGQKYLGKEIKQPDVLLEEKKMIFLSLLLHSDNYILLNMI